jgi:hypothetical protein
VIWAIRFGFRRALILYTCAYIFVIIFPNSQKELGIKSMINFVAGFTEAKALSLTASVG